MKVWFGTGILFFFGLLLVGCEGAGGIVLGDMVVSGDYGPGPDVKDVGGKADSGPEAVTGETGTVDVADEAFTECEPGSGCFIEPCSEAGDCQSGLCVDHMGDLVCSKYCVEECAPGWLCREVAGRGPDLVFACVSTTSTLCRPCVADADCAGSHGEEGVCVTYEGEGSFCGAACAGDEGCPGGFACADVLTVGRKQAKQCVHASGVCPCSGKSTALALSTDCSVTNEWGTCKGERTCTQYGLSECTAETPGLDECNAKDDDCDGTTDEETCEDGNDCTKDSCQGAQGCKHEALDKSNCDDQDPCTVTDHCEAGTCVGAPVECDDGNPCTDDACDAAKGCSFVPNSHACNDGDKCTVGDQCKGGECVPAAKLVCDDGNVCTADSCDENKGCSFAATPGACDDGNPCTAGDKCSEGKCSGSGLVDCDDGDVCTDDYCDPAAGCDHVPNTAPCNDSDLCTLNDTCSDGKCTGGAALGCDDKNACTTDVCSSVKGCLHTNNTIECDDLDPCTEQDACSGGVCLGSVAKDCQDGNPCTDDFCVPLAGCSHANNKAPCEDGNVCTLGDKCLGGLCNPGAAMSCDDGNVCTDDACDLVKGCIHSNNKSLCDDQNACTTGDVCAGGVCLGKGSLDCDDGNPCTKDTCLPGGGCKNDAVAAPCNDGDPCTVGDFCVAGLCKPGPATDCNDGNVCTKDGCDPNSGLCTHAAVDGNCDDGNKCTTSDVCKSGKCVGESPLDCDDKEVCTTDWCDPATGCVHKVNSAPCDDKDLCTTGDFCHLGNCIGAGKLTCDDGNPCTNDSCLPETGCKFSPNKEPCDDGNACTVSDVCAGGWCGGLPLGCDDANPCTKDSCDPATGCIHAAAAGPCDDGNACTLGDQCANGECAGGPAANCNDGNVCTLDTCDPKSGCAHNPIDGGCDDANICTTGDFCKDGACQPGTGKLDCDDKNACTDDSCDAKAGCAHSNNAAVCDDKNACTTSDKCAGGACTGGPAVVCNDNDVCTTDTCDPTKGCVYTPGACKIFSYQFSSGTAPQQACDQWNSFRSSLTANYSKVTIRGSYDQTGVSCSGPTANSICQAVRTAGTGTWNCDGRTWRVGECGGVELNADGSMCNCPSPSYIVRPCIANPNWGGAKTATCGGPAQTLEVLCQ